MNRSMRNVALGLLIGLLWLMGLAQGSQLLSAQSSYHSQGNFAILVLRFDEKVAHQLNASGDGDKSSCTISFSNCQANPQTAVELQKIKNALIRKVQLRSKGAELSITLDFHAPTTCKLRETERPYSLILDLSPAPSLKPPQPSQPAPSEVEKGKTTPKKAPAKPPDPAKRKERNRLAEDLADSIPPQHEEALQAQERALAFRQLNNKEAEVEQWEGFFQELGLSAPAGDLETVATSESERTTPMAQAPRDTIDAKRANVPEARGDVDPLLKILFGLAILGLGAVIVMMYLRQRELNRAIQTLLDSKVDLPAKKEGAVAGASSALGALENSSEEGDRRSDETTREVLGCYRAGMPISAIAEKFSMGQDEVRLVLNLAREERAKP